jgi:hypothetical protein
MTGSDYLLLLCLGVLTDVTVNKTRQIKNICKGVLRALFNLFMYGPIVIIRIVGYGAVLSYFDSLERDTTALSNTVLVALAAVSALAFTFAQTTHVFEGWKIPGRYEEEIDFDKLRVKITLAGTAFFFAAIYLILASVLKYLALNPPSYLDANFLTSVKEAFVIFCRSVAFGFFFGFTTHAVQGLIDLYNALRKFNDPIRADVEGF